LLIRNCTKKGIYEKDCKRAEGSFLGGEEETSAKMVGKNGTGFSQTSKVE